MKIKKAGLAVRLSSLFIGVLLLLFVTPPFIYGAQGNRVSEGNSRQPAASSQSNYVSGEMLIKFKPFVDAKLRQRVISEFKGKIRKRLPDLNAYLLELPKGSSVRNLVKAFAKNPNVLYAEPNYLRRISLIPNDPSYPQQWALPKIRAPEGWDITTGSPAVTVAVIDTGVDYNHQDLSSNIWSNPGETGGGKESNGIDDDSNGYVDDWRGYDFVSVPAGWVYPGEDPGPRDNDPMDFDGHGTHISGIANAQTNNGLGVAGVSWQSKIMPVRAGYTGKDGNGYLQSIDIVEALYYAANNGAEVINMSFGGPYSATEEAAVNYAWSKGSVLAAAAGNNFGPPVIFPASLVNTIAVSATNSSDQIARFSSTGPEIDVAAPGVSILSTFPSNSYGTMSGTSVSTPQVSGLAALLFAQKPTRSNAEVRTLIESTAKDLGPVGPDNYFGKGLIDVYEALLAGITPTRYENTAATYRTFYQENSSKIAYTGSWLRLFQAGTSGGYYNISSTPSATATLSFSGTEVTLMGTKWSSGGEAKVYVDGIYEQTIDFYGSLILLQQRLYTKAGLSPGLHTLKVEITGTKNPLSNGYGVVIDAFDTNIPWFISFNPSASGGNFSISRGIGSYALFSFNGTKVTLIVAKFRCGGKANIYIDDIFDQTIDLYSPTTLFQEKVYTKAGLSPGLHTIKVEVTGTKNASAANYAIPIDAFEVFE